MVTVKIGVSAIQDDGEQVARAVHAWAAAHPGPEPLHVTVHNGGIHSKPIAWPTGVEATIETFELLAASVGEHATDYQIQYDPDDRSAAGFGVCLLQGDKPNRFDRFTAWLNTPSGPPPTRWQRLVSITITLALTYYVLRSSLS